MLLDIRKLFSNPENARTTKFSFDFSSESFPGCHAAAPCTGTLAASFAGSALRLDLEGCLEVEGECARCLKTVRRAFDFSRSIVLREEGYRDSEEDLPFDSDGRLDVSELVYTEAVLALPSVLLCDVNCKGICPVCGRERSLGCSCEENAADDRLTIVKQLF